ncbi:glycosyltransferase [bacterium]|nr:MAG: glycosyltransferase [bacterium]
MTPLVSVCIPCFNTEKFVAEAIESVFNQTHSNVEVVVVDDGSTDGSVDVLKSFGDKIIFEANPNRGACATRNRAFELSSGKYIQFLDADDRLVPTKFERQLPFLESGEADLVFCHGFLFGDDRPMRPKKAKVMSPVGVDSGVYCLRQGLSTEGPLHRRECIERVGGFREGVKRAQEYDLHVRIGATNIKIHYIDDYLCEHRNHDGPRITRSVQPAGHMVELLLELSQILEKPPYDFTQERRLALAGRLFQHSIYAYRNGANQVAEKGFKRANELAAGQPIEYEERNAYKMLARAVGPFRVEQALATARRTASLIKRK